MENSEVRRQNSGVRSWEFENLKIFRDDLIIDNGQLTTCLPSGGLCISGRWTIIEFYLRTDY
jgi:hypothetical protein